MRPYKLSISNIAWAETEDEQIFDVMRKYDFSGIEIAPSRTWENPYEQTNEELEKFKESMNKKNLEVTAFQSLLFGHPEMTVFTSEQSRRDTLEYLKKCIILGNRVGAKSLVFGSPKNRLIGNMPPDTVREISHAFFGELGDFASDKNISICIEANPTIYGGDFICTTQEAVEFVRELDHPNVKINIDLGTIIANSENVEETLKEALPYAHHFHISEPYLEPIKQIEDLHRGIARELNGFGYNRTVSIEMKAQEIGEARIKTVSSAIGFVSSIY